MSFGDVALAGAFLKPGQFAAEKRYPLRLCWCDECLMLQVGDRIDPEEMFREYFYKSSSIERLNRHFAEYAREIARMNPHLAVEIGCNDGVMMRPLSALVPKVLGVDPADIAKGPGVINEFFSGEIAEEIVADYGHADVVIANNVFAHIPDINAATKAIKTLLAPGGAFVFEVHSLDRMIAGGQYDWVYHEHLYYYSLLSLERHFTRHGMSIYHVKPTGLHAGSRRYYACKDGRRASEAVTVTRDREIELGLGRPETFAAFAERAYAHRREMRALLAGLTGKVIGYGACGRANTMIQFCGIELAHMVDDAPAKHGWYTPGSHIEIKSRDHLDSDHLILFAWSFMDDILPKLKDYRGKIIVPLPEIRVSA